MDTQGIPTSQDPRQQTVNGAEPSQGTSALFDGTRLLERAQELAQLGTYTINLDRRTISLSPEMAAILHVGVGRIEMPLDEYRERFYHPDDLALSVVTAEEAYHQSHDLWLTSRVVRGDGEIIWVRTRSTVEELAEGPRLVLGVVQDITELARSHERDRLLSTLVASSEDAIFTIDLSGLITSWNPGAERLYGYLAEEIMGVHMSLLVVDDADPEQTASEVATLTERIGAVTSDQSLRLVHLRRRRKDGTPFILSATASPLRDDQGRVSGAVMIGHDVTELEEAHDRLRASEERFRALVQHGSDLIGLIGLDGKLLYISPSLFAMTGRDPQEVVGRPFTHYTHPDDAGEVEDLFQLLLRNPGSTINLTFRIVHRDGGVRNVEAIATNLENVPEVGGVVFNARDVTEAVTYREQLAHHALHDPLTGLANRALLVDRIGQGLRRGPGESGVILLLDIDHFQAINDAFGYPAGDEVLIGLGERMTHLARATDTVARLGGDRFAIWSENCTSEYARELADRLVRAVGEPFSAGLHDVSITASVGVAQGLGGGIGSPEVILRDADNAILHAKERGRGRFEIFDTAMSGRTSSRMQLRSELLDALKEGHLVLHYQPEIDLASGRVVGAEALIRWRHPTRGLVPPMDFIPAAEESDLILSIGRWVIERACHDAAEWPELGGLSLVSVNLSARQFHDPELEDHIARALQSSGLPASRLCLEITETLVMTDVDRTARLLDAVKSAGVQTAIDDFGTGYSSLAYLTQFPVDYLKIDRAFVEGLDVGTDKRGQVVDAVVGLAQSLGIKTIGEGVETDSQAESLKRLGCDIAQGYLFGRPVPHDVFMMSVTGS